MHLVDELKRLIETNADLEKQFELLDLLVWDLSNEDFVILKELLVEIESAMSVLDLETIQIKYRIVYLNIKAMLLAKTDQLFEALNLLEEASDLGKECDHIFGTLGTLRVYSYAYGYLGMLDKCLKASMEGYDLCSKHPEVLEDKKSLTIRFTFLNNIATVYSNETKSEEALEYYQMALAQDEAISSESRVLALSNISQNYLDMDDTKKAIAYLNEALDVANQSEFSNYNYYICYYGLGLIYFKMQENHLALNHFTKALSYGEELPSKFSSITAMIELGRLYVSMDMQEMALEYLTQAIEMGEKISANYLLKDAHLMASTCYETIKDWERATFHLKAFMSVNETVHSMELEKQMIQFSAELKIEQAKKDAEIFKLRNVELKLKNDEIEKKALALEESYRNLGIISQIGHEITLQLDIERLLETIYENVCKLMNINVFGIGFFDEETRIVEYKLFIENGNRVESIQISIDEKETFASQCIKKRDVVIQNEVRPGSSPMWRNKTHTNDSKMPRSVIYCPLMIRDKTIGIITVQSYEVGAFSDKDIEIIRILGTYIAIALNNSQKSESLKIAVSNLEISSITDPLTELYNRRYMVGRMHSEIEKYKRYRQPFSIFLADVDHFKQINDTYGHDCGDYVLRELALMMKHMLRKQDIIARWGGEEFLILLKDTNCALGFLMAQRLRAEIEEHEFIYMGQRLKITMTFGISEYVGESSIEETIKRADRALYQGKNTGKNKCIAMNNNDDWVQ